MPFSEIWTVGNFEQNVTKIGPVKKSNFVSLAKIT